MDGGKALQPSDKYILGSGGGGIIQIIAPQGSLTAGTLSMKHGPEAALCSYYATNGHFLLKGNYSYIKLSARAYRF